MAMNGYANRETTKGNPVPSVFYKNKGASTIENVYSYNIEVSRVEFYIT